MCKCTGAEQKIIKDVKDSNPHVCFYCKREISIDAECTVDHMIPVNRGGKTVKENLVIACVKCNEEKGDLTPEEYQMYLAKINNELNKLNLPSILKYLKDDLVKMQEENEKLIAENSNINVILSTMLNTLKFDEITPENAFEKLTNLQELKLKNDIEKKQITKYKEIINNQKKLITVVESQITMVKENVVQDIIHLKGRLNNQTIIERMNKYLVA